MIGIKDLSQCTYWMYKYY